MTGRKRVHQCPTPVLPRETVGALRDVSRVFTKNLAPETRSVVGARWETGPRLSQRERGWGT